MSAHPKPISRLAAFGGRPRFDRALHVGRPNMGDRERYLGYINGMLDRMVLTNYGPLVRELEARLAERLGVRHAITVCNGTMALELGVRALGMAGEVIVPAFTFVATAHALQWQEIKPVFVDIDPRTCTIDPECVERAITPRTTGILGVHLWGRGCDTEALADIARRRGLRLMYDAAHAFGCSHRGQLIGGFGDCEVFSLHATKVLHAGEGGVIATNDDDLAERVRFMQNFGFKGQDNVVYLGLNGKMSEACAAMGLCNLDSVEAFIAANRSRHDRYRSGLAGIPGVAFLEYPADERNNYQYLIVELEQGVFGLSRDQVYHVLQAENVLSRRYFFPGCHRMEPYRSLYAYPEYRLPVTEALCGRVLALPTGPQMRDEDVDAVCGLFRFLHEQAPAIRAALG